jgi:hypothetical protein
MKDHNAFREKLYHHTVPVRDDLWSRIESHLPEKVDKKRFPFFWVTFASILVMAGAILFWPQTNQPATPKPPVQEIPKEKESPVIEPLAPASDVSSTNETTASQSSELAVNASNAISEATTNATTVNAKSTKNESNIAATSTVNGIAANTKRVQSSIPGSMPMNISAAIGSSPEHTYQSEEAIQIATSNLPLSNEEFTHRSLVPSGSIESLPLSSLETTEKEAAEGHDINVSGEIDKIKPDPTCYKFTKKESTSNLSFDIFGGHGFSPRSFKSTGQESAIYAQARETTERNQYSWSAGGRINLNLNREFAVRAGLMYEQVGDIFDYTDTLATQRSTRIDSFFAADGSFLYAESNTILIFGTLIKKIHNRYHHLDIPLLASYEMPLGRTTFMINAGPVLNLTSSYRGQILDPGLIPQHITPRASNHLEAYKTNLGMSIYLSAGALIPFSDQFSGLVEPRFLYRINPVTVDQYPLKEHRHYAGLNIGIRYHFN